MSNQIHQLSFNDCFDPSLCFCELQIPALGKHYSQRWAQEDLLEEQREGARANDKKKNLLGGPLSELDAKGKNKTEDAPSSGFRTVPDLRDLHGIGFLLLITK